MGTSRAITELLALAERAAAAAAPVLLTGERGTGKHLIAAFIHAHSVRSARPLITIDCGAAPDRLDSECFGHVKGSFAGAQRDAVGKLELADSGTALLSDVDCASAYVQLLLLRFLETGELQQVGARGPATRVDVRVIATTSGDIAHLARNGAFREDLLCRLRVGHIHVPALRERPDDIAPLIAEIVERTGRAVRFTDEALALLGQYHWPGNIRELQSVVEQLVWMGGATLVDVPHLPPVIRTPGVRVASVVERRRQLADELFAALVAGTLSFWEGLYPLFLARDVTRHDLRELITRGLRTSSGSYRGLVSLFGMQPGDYKRLLNFLAAHGCGVDPRPFRKRGADAAPPPAIPMVVGSHHSPLETTRERPPARS